MVRRFLLSLMLATLCVVAPPVTVSAANPFSDNQNICSGKANQQGSAAAACRTDGEDPIAGVRCDAQGKNCKQGIFLDFVNIVAYFAGAVAVVMIIAGGIKFITSGTDVSTGSRTDTDVEDAKRMIGNALVGLAIIILSKVIIGYVIGRLQ